MVNPLEQMDVLKNQIEELRDYGVAVMRLQGAQINTLRSALSGLLQYAESNTSGDAELWYAHRDLCRNVLEDTTPKFDDSAEGE